MSPFRTIGACTLLEEEFPTLFLEYTPAPGDDVRPGEPVRLEYFDRAITVMLAMNPKLAFERRELGATVLFEVRRDGQEAGRILLAEGDYAPGARVYLCGPGSLRRCDYYLQPGWTLKVHRLDANHTWLQFIEAAPWAGREKGAAAPGATVPGAASPHAGEGAPGTAGGGEGAGSRRKHKRLGGPRPTTLEQRRQFVTGWLQAERGETQEAYCKRKGISTRTLRSWLSIQEQDE